MTGAVPITQPRVRGPFAALLVLGLFITMSDGFDISLLGVSLPLLISQHEWGITPATAGSVSSAQLLGMLVGALLAGYLSDKLGRRPVVIALLVLYGVFTVGAVFAPSLGVFLVSRVLAGAGVGGIIPTMIAHISEFSPAHRRFRSNIIMLVGTGIGGLIVPLLGIVLLPRIGFQGLWTIGGLFAIILIPFALALVPESAAFLQSHGRTAKAEAVRERFGIDPAEPGEQGQKARIRDLFATGYRRRTVLVTLGGAFVLGYGAAFQTWFPQLLVLGGVEFSSALIFTASFTAGSIIGMLIGGRLQDRGNPRIVVSAYFAGAAALLIVIGLVLSAPLPVIVVLTALLGAGSGPYLYNGLVVNIFPVQLRGTALSLEFGVGRAAAVLFGALGGSLAGAGLPSGLNFLAWSLLPFCALVTVLLLPAFRRGGAHETPAVAARPSMEEAAAVAESR